MEKVTTRHIPGTLLSLGLSLLIASCSKDDAPTPGSTEVSSGQVIEGQYIVVFKPGAITVPAMKAALTYNERNAWVKEALSAVVQEYGLAPGQVVAVYGSAITGALIRTGESDLADLRNDERVAYIEQDRLVMMAPPPGKGKGGGEEPPAGQETPYGITRVGGASDGTGKTAWILDTGIDLDHPDLNVDVSRSVTFITTGKDNWNADDGNGHGTHVAGTIAAVDNSTGVVGVAAGATVVSVKVLDSRGSGSYSGVIAGVDYVAANASPGDVANMSLSGPGSQALDDAVVNAAANGIGFALAAGNSGVSAGNYSPARANGTNVYTVSAMDANDVFAYFSNYGNPPVDYCAPGVDVTSCWKGGGYRTISGTSMAAPHVAGVLLVTGLVPSADGAVSGDPDGSADPIVHK